MSSGVIQNFYLLDLASTSLHALRYAIFFAHYMSYLHMKIHFHLKITHSCTYFPFVDFT